METRVLCFVLVSSLLILVCECAKNVKHKNYLHHYRRVENFRNLAQCGPPKETIVQLSEIAFDKKIHTDQQISPSVTVLHRCDTNCGCKDQGHICATESSEMLDLTFFVASVDGSHKTYWTGRAQNHTSCSCQPILSQPK